MNRRDQFLAVSMALLIFAPVACISGKCVTGIVCLLAAVVAARIARECDPT